MRNIIIALCRWVIKKLVKEPVYVLPSETFPKEIADAVEAAFVMKDKKTGKETTFYRFVNPEKCYVSRAIVAQNLWDFASLKISETELNEVMDAICAAINRGDNGRAYVLATSVKERTKWIFDPDACYEVAACIYFDAEENLAQYDPVYAAKKIAFWKENGDNDFFLQRILRVMYPSLMLSSKDFQTFLEGIEVKRKMVATAALSVEPMNTPKSGGESINSTKQSIARPTGKRQKSNIGEK